MRAPHRSAGPGDGPVVSARRRLHAAVVSAQQPLVESRALLPQAFPPVGARPPPRRPLRRAGCESLGPHRRGQHPYHFPPLPHAHPGCRPDGPPGLFLFPDPGRGLEPAAKGAGAVRLPHLGLAAPRLPLTKKCFGESAGLLAVHQRGPRPHGVLPHRLVFLEDVDMVQEATANITRVCLDRLYWTARVYRPEIAVAILKNRPKVAAEIGLGIDFLQVLEQLVKLDKPTEKKKLVKAWRSGTKAKTSLFRACIRRRSARFCGARSSKRKAAPYPWSCPAPARMWWKWGTARRTWRRVGNALYHRGSFVQERERAQRPGDDGLLGCHPRNAAAAPAHRLARQHRLVPVVPCSRNSGIVAMVPRARTLHGIRSTLKMSLLNYLLEQNTSTDAHSLRLGFLRSCAICSMQSMLFGLGDRHLETSCLPTTAICSTWTIHTFSATSLT